MLFSHRVDRGYLALPRLCDGQPQQIHRRSVTRVTAAKPTVVFYRYPDAGRHGCERGRNLSRRSPDVPMGASEGTNEMSEPEFPNSPACNGTSGEWLERDDFSSNRHTALSFCLSMISAQTLRVCREGKPVPTFPDHAPIYAMMSGVIWSSTKAMRSRNCSLRFFSRCSRSKSGAGD